MRRAASAAHPIAARDVGGTTHTKEDGLSSIDEFLSLHRIAAAHRLTFTMDQAVDTASLARTHYANRHWIGALEAFGRLDQDEPLGVDELEAYAWSAAMAGRTQLQISLFQRLYEQRLAQQDFAHAARAALWLGFRLFSLGAHGRGGGWLARAEAIVREHLPDSAEAGLVLIPQAMQQLSAGDVPKALAAADRAASIGDTTGDRDLRAFARNLQGRALMAMGEVEAGLRALDEAMLAAMSDELTPAVAGLLFCSSITACHSAYALDRCREWTEALSTWCGRQSGISMFAGACRVMRSEVMQLQGAWQAAEQEARAALDLAALSRGAVAHAATAIYQLAELQRLRGEHEAAEASYRDAMRHGMDPQPGLSLLRLAQGDAAAAAASISRICASVPDAKQRLRHLPAAVEIHVAAGRFDEARDCALQLRSLAGAIKTEMLAAIADHAQSQVLLADGDANGALEPARRALAIWRRYGTPYLAARLHVQVARACLALGDGASARLELESALEEFRALGARPDLQAAQELWRQCSAPQPGHKGEHPLTAREAQVLALVARGWSNKVIARELSLSGKTIDRHLSNIFSKLGVGSRTAAAMLAVERRLVPAPATAG